MIKKQFNLETWLNNKEYISVVTEYGEPVEIVKWNCRGQYPVLALIDDGDTNDACFYTADGISMTGSKLIIIADEKELKSKRRLRLVGHIIILFLLLLGITGTVAATVEFFTKGPGAIGIICGCFILMIGCFALILEIIDLIKDERKRKL